MQQDINQSLVTSRLQTQHRYYNETEYKKSVNGVVNCNELLKILT